jgi:RNA polymerase sigma factor (sigma-70 family)
LNHDASVALDLFGVPVRAVEASVAEAGGECGVRSETPAARAHVEPPTDRAALEGQLSALHENSFAWAVACCDGERERAEDVLQTTYIKVLSGRAQFAGRSSLKTWLFAVIRRSARSERRKDWLRRLRPGARARAHLPQPDDTTRETDPSAVLARDETSAQLRAALTQLSRRQRQVLELAFDHGLSLREAAEVMGVGLGTARSHYERAKAELRRRLEHRP